MSKTLKEIPFHSKPEDWSPSNPERWCGNKNGLDYV